jgi:ubiquinone/menaquinone biosynthesis C-methylase UbiE
MAITPEYDTQAENYDETRFTDPLGHHLDVMHKEILENLVDSTPNQLLEVGVGTGRFATWLAQKGFEVVGIDLSKQMLKKAKEKKSRLNVNVSLIRADVHFLPFKKGVFDEGICINVIDHFDDIDGFLKQVRWVIKRKGYFIFNFSNIQSIYLPIAVMINLRGRAMFKGGKIKSSWFTYKDIRQMLSKNGFDVTDRKGCFIASPIPFGHQAFKLIQLINFSAENSALRFFAGSPFLKVRNVERNIP